MEQSVPNDGGTKHRHLRVVVQAKDCMDEQFRMAIEQAREHGHTVEVRVSWEPEDVQRHVQEAVADQVDGVVAAGGDGMIHSVLNALVRPPAPPPCALGILPLGTGNDLAACCEFPIDDPVAAMAIATNVAPAAVDVIVIGDRVVLNVATGGPGTKVTQETPAVLKQLIGKAAYALSGIRHIIDLQAEEIEIVAPEFSWQGAFYILALGNGRQAGGGMQLCPNAMLDDGLLDLLIVPEMPLAQFLTAVIDIRQGRQLERDDIIYCQVPELELRAPGGTQLNTDGEPLQIEEVQVRVLPRYLPLLLPPEAPVVTLPDDQHSVSA